MVDLSIVIVSWNVRELLQACLESIAQGPVLHGATSRGHTPCLEVIVVDSGSRDGSPEVVRQDSPWVEVIEPGGNVGFARGNNIGMAASKGRYILLLNPDTKVLGDAVVRMIRYMDAHPEVGVVGPQLLNEDGTVQSSRRRFPTLATAFFESTWFQPIAPPRVLRRYYMLDRDDSEILPVDWVTGAAVMARREIVEQVGGLDEGFFMYSEELDWQRRIKAAGWQVVYFPEAQVIHYGGKSSEQVIAQRDIRFHTSKIRYFRKHHGWIAAVILWLFLLGNYAWQLVFEGAKWLVGHKREMRLARLRSYAQVLRSGLWGWQN
jgi:N-acetylglucosaminyl-diphospho-decaprenol L-rhamnosyltransferase